MNEEYKSVCDRCYRKTWYGVEQPCKQSVRKMCKCCGQSTIKVIPCLGTLRVIDNSKLDSRFSEYYKTGQRVEIIYKDGTKTRCYIGKSSGWVPIWLEIKRIDSSGGGSLYLENIDIIRPLLLKRR